MAEFKRGAGILCHISSLSGKYGIGTLGKEAYDFVNFLKSAHVKYWQVLPLQQTGYGDSPYQSVCCNSGNPYFIDLDSLYAQGLLTESELKSCENTSEKVDYGWLYETRYEILRTAFSRFDTKNEEFADFVNGGEFNDYALFMTLKSKYPVIFDAFPDCYKYGDKSALSELKEKEYDEYCFWQFLQFVFKKQWLKLKNYANSLGIKIVGDIPLYVAYDSSDVWARPDLFMLDERLNPTEVAGVPPDYFSKTGQLWGNPLYDWAAMEKDGYLWWQDRIKKAKELYDIIRIDHFRGFDRYYAIPYGSKTAETGEWKQGPKEKLFEILKSALGDLPVIAEDLGVMDDGVIRLRDNTGFPGMKILLFAFDGTEDNAYLPKLITKNSVTYTGTHDNSTALGALKEMSEKEFKAFKKQLRASFADEETVYPFVTREEAALALVKCAMCTKSDMAIVPVQDLLCLDDSCRMNMPSTPSGNWQFRLSRLPERKYAATMRKFVKESNRD